jgi:putative heme-binding domain-containing protein
LETIAAGKASARLLQERPVLLRLRGARIPDIDERVARLTKGLPAPERQLAELLRRRLASYERTKPDAARGALVFEKHCATCHQLAGKGAKIGPQLDGIGVRGLDRLMEDLIDPNRNVDQAFRTTTLLLRNGQLVTGLVLREEGEVLVLADNQGKELRVAGKQVEERTLSQVSLMPANLMEQIQESDSYDLVAYLLAQRAR